MSASARVSLAFSLLLVAPACGGGSSGGGEEPPALNSPPSLQVPLQVSGSGSSYRFASPISSTDALVFTATDPDNDPLQWQLVAIGDPATVGVTIPLSITGSTFSLAVDPVALPAACDFVLFVEDPRGGAAAVDLQIVRSGPPTITGITPSSAFRAQPQQVTITGEAFSLGGTANTSAHFQSMLAGGIHVPDETTLRCSTPAGIPAGPVIVRVSNNHGNSQLPATAFTGYTFPPQFPAADTPLDGGAGSALTTAASGALLAAVWLEGGAVIHRGSTDGGASWSAAQTLSGGETPTEPQVTVAGSSVTVVWVGDGTSLQTRSSIDGGATFQPAAVLNPLAGATPAEQPRIDASGDRTYVVWLAGDPGLGTARLTAAASADAGTIWSAPQLVDDGGFNQTSHVLECDGATAWLAFLDLRQGPGVAGTYTSRTLDGAQTWSTASRRSPAGAPTSEPRLRADGANVHLTWLRGDALDYVRSDSAGAAWTVQPVELNDPAINPASAPALACEGTNIFAAYVGTGTSVWVARITALGAIPDRIQVSSATVNVGSPRLYHQGNYVFAAWRSDDVGTGLARIALAVSTDLGQTYSPPNGFGNGTAAQELPHLLVGGARATLLWLDHRGATPALFATKNDG